MLSDISQNSHSSILIHFFLFNCTSIDSKGVLKALKNAISIESKIKKFSENLKWQKIVISLPVQNSRHTQIDYHFKISKDREHSQLGNNTLTEQK